ncbi:hypothetical protein RUND412_000383 [Rhizina undulata]
MSISEGDACSKEVMNFEAGEIKAEKVVHTNGGPDTMLYYVHWRGYDEAYDTWEPSKNLLSCPGAIEKWNSRRSERTRGAQKRMSTASNSHAHLKRGSSSAELTTSALENARSDTNNFPGTGVSRRGNRSLKQNLPMDHKKLTHPDSLLFQEQLDKIKGPPVILVNDIDDIPSPPLAFEFIDELRLGQGVPEHQPEFGWGCGCPIGGCKPGSCQCVQDLSEKKFAYSRGKINRDSALFIIECNQHCSCGPSCRNRVVQKGRQLPLEVFKTEKKGWGLRCPQMIKKGTFIDLYLGEVIGPEEALRRTTLGDRDGLSYLFDLDKFENAEDNQLDDYGEPLKVRYTIDAQYCGGVSRFLNHSCDPNLDIYTVGWERRDFSVYNLALFAVRDIPPYEELSFSYVNQHYEGNNDKEDTKKRRNGKMLVNNTVQEEKGNWPCYCGASNCRRFLW